MRLVSWESGPIGEFGDALVSVHPQCGCDCLWALQLCGSLYSNRIAPEQGVVEHELLFHSR